MGRMAVQGSRASSGCGSCGAGAIHPMCAPFPARVLRPRTLATRALSIGVSLEITRANVQKWPRGRCGCRVWVCRPVWRTVWPC